MGLKVRRRRREVANIMVNSDEERNEKEYAVVRGESMI